MKVEFTTYGTEAYLQNNKAVVDPFIVFKNGTVKTNTYFQADMYGYFLIQVRAEENVTGGAPFVANATLRVSITLFLLFLPLINHCALHTVQPGTIYPKCSNFLMTDHTCPKIWTIKV